jgi:lipoprotein-anchoring transpeptidase ErfK/SrfK
MGRKLAAFASLLSAAGVAAVSAPATAVGRPVLERPADGWVQVQQADTGHLIARVRPGHVVALRTRPAGPVVARVGAKTKFGSGRSFAVSTTRRGRWLAVTDAGVSGNRTVWVDAQAGGLRYARTPLELDVDLSSRTLTVRRGQAVVRHIRIGVGRAGSPTPTGRFAVTDKLDGSTFSATYGCCILALSATQPNVPAGWRGGNRIAIHGTLSTGDFGRAVSAGCVHARDADLRYLMRRVPLGTPVVIRP